MAPVKVFVAAAGNGFMRDIAEWLVEAAHLAGHDASLHSEQVPSADGSINLVVAPHEFFALSGLHGSEMQRAAAASVCVATEQPGTPWFEASLEACSAGLTTLDINPHGVAALRAKGVNAHHLQLGAVPSMVAAHQAVGDRPLDLVFLGGLDQRRSRVLAGLAPRLWRYRSELRLFRFEQPITAATPGVLFGSAKYRLLGSARGRPAPEPPGPAWVPVGPCGEILDEIPPEFRSAAVVALMRDAESLGPDHCRDLVRSLGRWFHRQEPGRPRCRVCGDR